MCKEIIMKLYLVKFQFSKKECYALWYTDDVDGFILDENGKIRSFASEEKTRLFANRKGYHLLEYFFRSCTNGKLQVFGDNSGGDVEGIYQKLFYGCNLPAIRKDGEIFVPEWNESERKRLAEIFDNGFRILSDAIE